MFFVKCSCGCIFTAKDNSQKESCRLTCANCGNSIYYSGSTEKEEFQNSLAKTGIAVQVIPDDAKITVTFDA